MHAFAFFYHASNFTRVYLFEWSRVRTCPQCGDEVTGFGKKVYCSVKCKGMYKYTSGRVTTATQDAKTSGNWRRYVQRLIYLPERKHLKLDDLLQLLENQNYICALSGEPLTCTVGGGMKHMTNASLDRIKPGGPYEFGNIRWVCRIANVMKWNMSDDELRQWCKRILNAKVA